MVETNNAAYIEQALLEYAMQQGVGEWSISEQAYQPTDVGSATANMGLFKDKMGLIGDDDLGMILAIMNGTFDYSLLDDVAGEAADVVPAPNTDVSDQYRNSGLYDNMFSSLEQGTLPRKAAQAQWQQNNPDVKFPIDDPEAIGALVEYQDLLSLANKVEKEVAQYSGWQRRQEQQASTPMVQSDAAKKLAALGVSTEKTTDSYFQGDIDDVRARAESSEAEYRRLLGGLDGPSGENPYLDSLPASGQQTLSPGLGVGPPVPAPRPAPPTPTAPTAPPAPAAPLPSSGPNNSFFPGMSIDTDPNNPLAGPRYEQQAQQIEEAFAARREREGAGTASKTEGNWQEDIRNLRDDLEAENGGNSGGNWWQDIKDLKFWGNDEEGTESGAAAYDSYAAELAALGGFGGPRGGVPMGQFDPAPDVSVPGAREDPLVQPTRPPSRLPGTEAEEIERLGLDGKNIPAFQTVEEFRNWMSANGLPVPSGLTESQSGKGAVEDQYGGSRGAQAPMPATPWTLNPGAPPATPERLGMLQGVGGIADNKRREQALLDAVMNSKVVPRSSAQPAAAPLQAGYRPQYTGDEVADRAIRWSGQNTGGGGGDPKDPRTPNGKAAKWAYEKKIFDEQYEEKHRKYNAAVNDYSYNKKLRLRDDLMIERARASGRTIQQDSLAEVFMNLNKVAGQ
tara:strand:+ start:619 stop:2652 length:2034 start_codon:yes stop_codon:yes gene_type:complete